MNEALKTLPLPNWLATLRSTSLQALEDGALPCELQDGPTTDPCGLGVALANLSARQAKAAGLLTSGTYGRHGSTLSASASLQSSLVSRLKRQLIMGGSTLFKMTWREKVTPSGRLVFRLRASGHRTSGNDYGSWPTPNCPMKHDSDHSAFRWNPNKKQDDPVTLILGRTQSLSDVPMEKRGQLNPRFSLWLMGYPTGWATCGEQVTPSSRKSRRK